MDGAENESKDNKKKVRRWLQWSTNDKTLIIYEYDILGASLLGKGEESSESAYKKTRKI